MNRLSERKNPHRLFRDREHAMIAGVCAGMACGLRPRS
jgi:phage shock protein PspC (stress-responsive transcriptional regulator)